MKLWWLPGIRRFPVGEKVDMTDFLVEKVLSDYVLRG